MHRPAPVHSVCPSGYQMTSFNEPGRSPNAWLLEAPQTNRIWLYLKQDLSQSLLGEHYTSDVKLWFEEDKRRWKLHE